MKTPKFSVGSLVSFNSEIYEILEIISTKEGFSYKAELRAYLREPSVSEWENQLYPSEAIIEEEKLNSFEHNKPKFKLGERVKLPYFACKVRFIQFENYHYEYHVMNETHDGSISHGWMVEEGYLSK